MLFESHRLRALNRYRRQNKKQADLGRQHSHENRKIKIQHVETGITYSSIREAAEKLHIGETSVGRSIKDEVSVKGMTFRKL